VLTELWRSDGTEDGTRRVWQAPGRSNGYAITNLTWSGRHLFFSAPSGTDASGVSADVELYAIRLRASRDADDTTDPDATDPDTADPDSTDISAVNER